ncbi:MAG: CBS domain-containing protein [Anaerolineae bacterium]|nr:CBS domain-containing protein [Anaerolineae bacterium]
MIHLQKLAVRDAQDLDPCPSLIVGPDEDFSRIVQRFAELPELRGIFVADTEQRLLGVITRTDLLDWADAKLGPLLQLTSSSRERNIRLGGLIRASTAAEVMHPDSQCSAVKPDDSLAHALQLMIELNLVVLPVVDETNRIVEDLKLSELLARAAEENARSVGVR